MQSVTQSNPEKKIADLKISGYTYGRDLNDTQVALEPLDTLILDTILEREMKKMFKQKAIPDIRCSIAKFCKLISILSPSNAVHSNQALLTYKLNNIRDTLAKKNCPQLNENVDKSTGRQSSVFLHLYLTFSEATSTKERTEKASLTSFSSQQIHRL